MNMLMNIQVPEYYAHIILCLYEYATIIHSTRTHGNTLPPKTLPDRA